MTLSVCMSPLSDSGEQDHRLLLENAVVSLCTRYQCSHVHCAYKMVMEGVSEAIPGDKGG